MAASESRCLVAEESIVKHWLMRIDPDAFPGYDRPRRRPADDDRRPAGRQVGGRSADLARRRTDRLRGLGARPGHRQDQQQPLARSHVRRRAEAPDHRARDQQPPALEPRRQDHLVRLQPRRLVPGLAAALGRRRGPAAHETADRRLGADLVAQGRQDRLHGRGLPRNDPRANRGQGQGERGAPRARSAPSIT